MIDTAEFIDYVGELTEKEQSGFSTGKNWTGYINQSQNELAEYLNSIQEINQHAVDLITPLIVVAPLSSNSVGLIAYPNGYNHFKALRYLDGVKIRKTQYLGTNQVGIVEDEGKIPQRKSDLTKGRINYTFLGTGIQVYPKQVLTFELVYIKYPTKAAISYNYTEVNGEPKRTVASQTNMDWNMNCFNLLVYMVMDKMGLAKRDLILNEYAQLGIAKESVKQNN